MDGKHARTVRVRLLSLGLLATLTGALLAAPVLAETTTPAEDPLRRPPVGYGRYTTGGAGGEDAWVSSLADSGPGTLREALETPGPRWVRFAVSGDVHLNSAITVTRDKTVDGRGTRVTLHGKGLRLVNADNVIVSHLGFADTTGDTEDAIRISDGAANVWIRHCDFGVSQDGSLDISRNATNVTVEWNRFVGGDKVMLINTYRNSRRAKVTVHHNVFANTVQRNPLVHGADVHAYNNYLSEFSTYGMRSDDEGSLLSQANVLSSTKVDRAIVSRGTPQGRVRSEGDVLGGIAARIETYEPHLVTVPNYPYLLEPAGPALVDRLLNDAGRGAPLAVRVGLAPDGADGGSNAAGDLFALTTASVTGWQREPVRLTVATSAIELPGLISEYRVNRGAWQPYAGPLTLAADGVHTVEARAGHERLSVVAETVTVAIDATKPVTRLTGPLDGQDYTVNTLPAPACTTTDATSGVAEQARLTLSGGPVGQVTATCSGGSDQAGNLADAVSVTYTVRFDWEGFGDPVRELPIINKVKAGRFVPLRFSLGGDRGLDVVATYPTSSAVPCDAGAPLSEVEQEATGPNGALTYDAASGLYAFVWRTYESWRGCRLLSLTLADGSVHHALFKFRR